VVDCNGEPEIEAVSDALTEWRWAAGATAYMNRMIGDGVLANDSPLLRRLQEVVPSGLVPAQLVHTRYNSRLSWPSNPQSRARRWFQR
jgi:hypothetical protein